MIIDRLDDLNEECLHQICVQHCLESQTIDFKRDLPTRDDRGKHEFLKDICALANADGGDLVYGVVEEDGGAKELSPILSESVDAAKRHLGQVLESGIEPRLVGVRFQDVRITAGGYILVVRVPASFDGPHRYLFNGHSKFVMRSNTHNSELSYGQLRMAFDRTATLAERMRCFREDRLNAISNGRASRPIYSGPICVMHVIPMASMTNRNVVDIKKLYSNYMDLIFNESGNWMPTLNLDGLVVHKTGADEKSSTYTQVFRAGALEAVRFGGRFNNYQSAEKVIPSTVIAKFFREATIKLIPASCGLGFAGPAIVGTALLQVQDYKFAYGRGRHTFIAEEADRHNLILPEVWVENIELVDNIDEIVRPMLDMLWQGFDVEYCELYNERGGWIGL